MKNTLIQKTKLGCSHSGVGQTTSSHRNLFKAKSSRPRTGSATLFSAAAVLAGD